MEKKRVKWRIISMVLVLLFLGGGVLFSATCGDVNSSGGVDIVDALSIAKYYVGYASVDFDETVADVTGDGAINIVDALSVAQYYVGLIDELSCPVVARDPIWTGGGYSFNGSTDYVDLPDGITSSLDNFSVACWVQLSTLVNWTRVFDFGGDTDLFMMFTPASGSTGYPYFAITTSGNDGEQGINGTQAFSTGSWQHIGIVKSGNTGILYINGLEAGRNENITLKPADLGNTTNNYIGRSQWAQDPYLNGYVDKFYIYDQALSSAEMADLGRDTPAVISPTPKPSPSNFKIMPLGDSITDGTQIPGGYRIKLWSNIQNAGKTADFVGSQTNGPSELSDKNHEGHPGWRIEQISGSINGWMDTYNPRIVLLHIGTNDFIQSYNVSSASSRLSTLIDQICAKLPEDGKLYVAQIIPLSNGGQNQNLVNFNNQIPGIVQSKVSSGKPVYMVDMYNALSTSDLLDGVHPTQNGYNKMADVWYNAIKNDL